jgi:aspartyl/asparaginyl beta-hydroxylase (cupin superfamily)
VATLREQINAHIETHLRTQLARSGYDQSRSSRRFTQSLDLLSGRKRRYIQEPRAHFFPELPDVQFYPREQFPWLDRVEAATDDICAELMRVMEKDSGFVPYIQAAPDAPMRGGHQLLNNADWSAFFLVKDGTPVAENVAQCPKTLAALEQVPFTRIKGRAPSILFSRLKPGTRIAPHSGFLNSRLICHLPLIVPPGCHFRVGNDARQWEKGKAWVFNDTIEHEAFNSSSETRVILIFDIWRPELTPEECTLISTLMEAVDTYPGGPVARWSD